jgi:HEAT repeat protein
MPRRDPLEATLEQLSAVRSEPTTKEALALLRKVLAGRSSHATAVAAEIAGEAEIEALVPDLVAAFARLLEEPVKRDPTCHGKAAIVEALYCIGALELDVYLKGVRYVQMEPVWGGKKDTAVELRGISALAMVRSNHPDYLTEVAELLADPEDMTRRYAAQAFAYSENPAAIPVLRLKALVGDEDPQVLNECLLALLKIAPAEVEFVARFLNRPEVEIVEAAALALGGSRLAEAFGVLRQWIESQGDVGLRRSGLLAIAMLKRDEAIAYLLASVVEGEPIDAREAIRALAIYKHDENLRGQVKEALDRRKNRPLLAFFEETFGSPE